MTTERFSKAEFETALTMAQKDTSKPLWEYVGFEKGEHVYKIQINSKHVAILIRSSIKADGYAADTGDDSIGMWLVNTTNNKPLGKKVDAYTTPVKGWDERIVNKIRELYTQGYKMVNCPKCNDGVMVERKGRYGKFYGCSNYPRCKHTMQSLPQSNATPKPVVIEKNNDLLDEVLTEEKPIEYKSVKLNAQQQAYVNAPINANLRVMAGPGSGKTTATVERIVHLIENGVDPNTIVYTTFSKDMADEGYKRILARLPQVANTNLSKQVCTIHALCFRILYWEGLKFNVAKEWQVKKMLSEIIDEVWAKNPEKPGWKEVLLWIDSAKLNGLTANEDYAFYLRYLGNQAASVHQARVQFDEQMQSQKLITFADMPYKVEQMLIHNRQFREKWQAKFTHILVDEAQDTNEQALRILITLSLEAGDNRVYI